MKTLFIVTFCLFLFNFQLVAQHLEGQIMEEINGKKSPLIGANVFWMGTQIGASTNAEGHFDLKTKARKNDSLIVRFVGYKTDTFLISDFSNAIEIIMLNANILSEVEIKSSESGSHISRIGIIHKEIITSSELRKAACCNLSESFQSNASVDVNYADAVTGAKQIQLLGLAGIYTQMMTENIPNFRGLSVPFSLGYVPGSWMESIQISKGTSAVTNGFESTTGQINVEFKKPNLKEKLFVNLYGNSFGKFEGNLNSSYNINKNLSTIALLHYENMSVKNDHNKDGFIDDPLVSQVNFMNRWLYDAHKNVEARFGFSILGEDRKAGQLDYNFGSDIADTMHYGTAIKTNRVEAYSKIGFFFDDEAKKSLGLLFNGTIFNQGAFFGSNSYKGLQNTFYFNSIYQSYFGNTNHSYNTGLSLIADDYNEWLNDSNYKRTEIIPGAFFQYTFTHGEHFSAIVGLRADYHNDYGLVGIPRIHLRWNPFEETNVRISAGRGFRTASVVAENLNLLISNRKLVYTHDSQFEDAWNYGINVVQYVHLFEKELTISLDYYRTDFMNQIIVDIDQDVRKAIFYNLKGKSFSNSFQAEVKYELIKNLEITAAFRLNDVQMTINDTLRRKAYVSKYKGLVSASYATRNQKWKFDITAQFNGGGRLPSTQANSIEYQRENSFKPYTLLFGQITKSFKLFDVYIGAENITNYVQHHPIVAANNPKNDAFDASMIWGPLSGRVFYAGFRLKIIK